MGMFAPVSEYKTMSVYKLNVERTIIKTFIREREPLALGTDLAKIRLMPPRQALRTLSAIKAVHNGTTMIRMIDQEISRRSG